MTAIIIIIAAVIGAAAVFASVALWHKKRARRPMPNYERYGLRNPKYERFR